ncbi:hemerythrin domain-containing protein [Luedemannella flava]
MSVTLERVDGDVVDVLLAQHDQIKRAMARVPALQGAEKAEAFALVTELLERHERGEQQVVHPATRDDVESGGRIAGDRLTEEANADMVMAEMAEMDVDDPMFDVQFTEFRNAVLAHAEREEMEEFPRLRADIPAEELAKMADDLVEAENM